MNKEEMKKKICKAIDNIPNCAKIDDCYVEHSYYGRSARIILITSVKDSNESSINEFHDIAHDSFGTDLGFIS